MANRQGSVRQTFVLPVDLIKKIDQVAADSKRSRNATVEILLNQAVAERERRFKRIHKVIAKIDDAATDEDAARYDEELLEAIFGPQKQASRRAQDPIR